MRILTLNTWQERGPWKQRWNIILAGIQQSRPDVICFQEVFNSRWAREVQKKARYPFLVFPKEPGGLMMLSRFPVRRSACVTLRTQSPTEDYKRYGLFAEISARGHQFAVFNTHLSWRIREQGIRGRQVDELMDFIHKRAGKMLSFVMGDFNAAPRTPEIRKVVYREKFTDLYRKVNPAKPGLTWNNANPFTAGSSVRMPNRRIDYIFMRNSPESFRIRNVKLMYEKPVRGLYASDHNGILAELHLGE